MLTSILSWNGNPTLSNVVEEYPGRFILTQTLPALPIPPQGEPWAVPERVTRISYPESNVKPPEVCWKVDIGRLHPSIEIDGVIHEPVKPHRDPAKEPKAGDVWGRQFKVISVDDYVVMYKNTDDHRESVGVVAKGNFIDWATATRLLHEDGGLTSA